MVTEFDSDPRQLEAQSELEGLTLTKIMGKSGDFNFNISLDQLVKRNNSLTPQCPRQFRSDDNKIRCLRSAVLQQDWATPALSQITTAKFTYNHFVTAVREQLQFYQERNGSMNTAPLSNINTGKDNRQVLF